MRIESNHRPVRPVDSGEEAIRQVRSKDGVHPRRDDAVEISDNAKRLHAEATGKAAGSYPSMCVFGERIRSGFYDSDEVVSCVARRIIDLGDL